MLRVQLVATTFYCSSLDLHSSTIEDSAIRRFGIHFPATDHVAGHNENHLRSERSQPAGAARKTAIAAIDAGAGLLDARQQNARQSVPHAFLEHKQNGHTVHGEAEPGKGVLALRRRR